MDCQQQRRLGAVAGHLLAALPTAGTAPPPLRVAVTGTSVGIGLEFVRQYAAAGARVFALCRSPSSATDLQSVAAASNGRVTVHALDQTDSASVGALQEELAGVPIDIMINNAAAGGSGPTRADYSEQGQMFGGIDYDAWADTMDTNVFGVLRATEAVVPSLLLSEHPKLVMLSSAAGSITNAVRDGQPSPDMVQTISGHQEGRAGSPGYFVYRSSKAAMNMVNRLLDCELAPLVRHAATAAIASRGYPSDDLITT